MRPRKTAQGSTVFGFRQFWADDMRIHARHMLMGDKWVSDALVTSADGKIASINLGVQPAPQDHRVDILLPALANLHSHTFQRAMAGMTEVRAAGRESFWTWRDLMYRFLNHLTPDHYEAIAALAFMEMQEAGFASVGEFHYVHHQQGGAPYDDLAELSACVFSAANETGIGLTHLPVLYTHGGVNQEPLSGGQLRFANDVEGFLKLHEACVSQMGHLPEDSNLGIAPHSLRATSPGDLTQVLEATSSGPVHIHIAEQTREVDEVQAKLGARPVEWLLDHVEVDARWCLVHATHMSDAETAALAQSGAVAGLCPITEANLGDGAFNGPTFLEHGGAYGIGSDSNVRISVAEELRMLEYSQRLRDMQRNLMIKGSGSVGQGLYKGAAQGGAQALARASGEIKVGHWADLVALDHNHPALCALRPDQVLDGFCFAGGNDLVTDCWSAGRHTVKDGQHVHREAILSRYRSAMSDLVSAL